MNSMLLAQTLPTIFGVIALILVGFSVFLAVTVSSLPQRPNAFVNDLLQGSAILALGFPVGMVIFLPTVLLRLPSIVRLLGLISFSFSMGAFLGIFCGTLLTWMLRRKTAQNVNAPVMG